MLMKRVAMLGAILLALPIASAALGKTGGPGKFQSKITGTGPKTANGMLDGTWTIDLKSWTSGPLNLTVNGHNKGGGTYAISGYKITFTPKQGGSCTTKGKYTFTLSGKTLTFTKLSDSCTVRFDVLTAHSWKKIT
jgi:hypothetical protein